MQEHPITAVQLLHLYDAANTTLWNQKIVDKPDIADYTNTSSKRLQKIAHFLVQRSCNKKKKYRQFTVDMQDRH